MGANSGYESGSVTQSGGDTVSQYLKLGYNQNEAWEMSQQKAAADAQQAELDKQLQREGISPMADAMSGSESVRRRGDTNQQRVGQDTRVREIGGSEVGMGKTEVEKPKAQAPVTQGGMWSAKRAPTDLASVQSRVLKSITGLN